MDSNEEKKPKRPRIGENRIAASSEGDTAIFGKVENDHAGDYHQGGESAPRREYGSYDRPYQPRNNYNNRQGGYNNNRQGGYGNNRYNNQEDTTTVRVATATTVTTTRAAISPVSNISLRL